MEFIQKFRGNFRSQEVPYSQEVDEQQPNSADTECLITSSSKRTCTDLPFFIAQACLSIIFLFFLGYCIANGDIQRVTRGFDDCGNVCGKTNHFSVPPNTVCRALDMTDEPFLLITSTHRSCVKSCSDGFVTVFDRCIPKDDPSVDTEYFVNTIFRDLRLYSSQIIYLVLIAVALAIVLLVVLRFMTAAFVWTSIVGFIVAGFIGAIYFGIQIGKDFQYVHFTVLLSVLTLVVLISVIFLRKRIPLIISLFKESGKVISAIPLLLMQPVFTFITLAIIWSAWVDFALWIESAGTAVVHNSQITFSKNAIVLIARWYNHVIMLWMVCFIFGCQSMLLSGVVTKWFFTRDKSNLGNPICTSAYNTIRYHLGTISLGSLILLIIKLIRIALIVLRLLLRRTLLHLCLFFIYRYLEMLVAYVEKVVQILTRNAYCITAIYGFGFREAGKRAWEIIINNALSFLAIYSIGTFVLFLAKIIVVIATILIGFAMTNMQQDIDKKWPLLVISGIIAYLVADCFFSVYEMATNTIFVCYCEDVAQNDGMARPYFMSTELMQFAEKCKTVVPPNQKPQAPQSA